MPPEMDEGAGIDFSDEGLEARIVAEESDVPETNDDAPVEAVAGEEAPAEVEGEEPPAVEEPPADPMVERYRNAEQMIGRQAEEIGKLRQTLESMMTAEPEQQAPQPFGQFDAPQTLDDLLDMANDTPEQAYAFALEHAPDALPHVLAEIRQSDPSAAEDLLLRHQGLMVQGAMHELREEMRQQVQPVAQMQQSTQQAAAVDHVAGRYADFNDLREDVAGVIQQHGAALFAGADPQSVAAGVEKAYLMARSNRYEALVKAQAIQQGQLNQSAGAAAVVSEGSTSAVPEEVEATPADDIRAGIFEANKSLTW